MKKEMTCIVCPIGCRLKIETDDNNKVISVEGNSCQRGYKYAVSETQNPVRTLTSTVRITGSDEAFLPIKTSSPMPKHELFSAMQKLSGLTVNAPVKIGDIIYTGVTEGINIIACKSVESKTSDTVCLSDD